MSIARLFTASLLALASPYAAALDCGEYQSIDDVLKEMGRREQEAQAAANALSTARTALSAQLRTMQVAVPAAWRQADASVSRSRTLDEHAEMIRLVKAVYDPNPPPAAAEQAVLVFSDALKQATEKQSALENQKRCANELFGIGPGHINTIVLVGDEAKLGYVFDPENSKDEVPEIIETLRTECLKGEDIRRLGVASGLANVTRVEGLAPFTAQRAEKAGQEVPKDAKQIAPVELTPKRGVLIMAAEYAGRWEDQAVKLQCVRLMYLGQAAITSIAVGTYGHASESQNRVDLLRGPLASRVSGRLRDTLYVGIPVRKVMSYQTSRAAEDVLMDGQEIELAITRGRSALERSRTVAREGTSSSSDTFQTTWDFRVGDMPRAIVRLPILAGLVLTEDPKADDKPVWTVGPALGLSYRFPIDFPGWEGRYVSPELFVHVAQRIGDSSTVPDTLWGGGVQLDLSGYLGIGFAYMGDIRFTKPQWMFTIAPVPWISHALGLEKTLRK